ncbi:hypothetical protein BV25DRAFT_1823152, partial [Artomyces pyxidatus]
MSSSDQPPGRDIPTDAWNDKWDSVHVSSALSEPQFELCDNLERMVVKSTSARVPPKYSDGNTIDWWYEDFSERERWKGLLSQFVIVCTGIGVGVAGGWLDVLVKWLGDLREGRCTSSIFYNSVACYSGLDPGEVCNEWRSWSNYLGVHSILGQFLLQSFIYIVLSVAFAASEALSFTAEQY